MTLNENSIDASFKISNTTAGSDAIADAMDALAQGGGGVRAFDILTRAMQDKLEDKHG